MFWLSAIGCGPEFGLEGRRAPKKAGGAWDADCIREDEPSKSSSWSSKLKAFILLPLSRPSSHPCQSGPFATDSIGFLDGDTGAEWE